MNKKFRKAEVLLLSASHLMHDTFTAFLPALLPLLIAKLNISLSTSAILDIVRRTPSLFNPFFGLLAEKKGLKYFVIFTPLLSSVSMCLLGLAPSVGIVIVLLFTAGTSAALYHVASPVMTREASGEMIGTGMSFFMVGGELARTVGPLLITAAISRWTLEGTWRLIFLGAAASAILYIKLKDFKVERPLQKAEGKGETKALLHRKKFFLIVVAGYIIFEAGIKSLLTLYLPVYLTGRGDSLWFASISLAVLQFCGVAGAFVAGHISDRIGRKNALLLSACGTVFLSALFTLTTNIILLGFLGFFLLSTGPILMAAVQDNGEGKPTFMNGLYMALGFGVSSVMVFIVGLLGDRFGLEITYRICVLFALGTIPTALFLEKSAGKTRVKS